MARNTNIVLRALLLILSLLSVVQAAPGNWRGNEDVCESYQYKDLLYLADYSPAQDYCQSHYPYVLSLLLVEVLMLTLAQSTMLHREGAW